MSRVYDNWERLVAATLDREKLRQLALCESFNSSSISGDFDCRFSFDSIDVSEATRISIETISPEVSFIPSIPASAVRPIKFREIKGATRNFHADLLLGERGFGPVFKGWIDQYSLTAAKLGFGMPVAIKTLHPHTPDGLKEWLAELNYLSQLHHPNVIKLIGCCSEEDNHISVYEFMPSGSLDVHLFKRRYISLSWATRMKVAIGTARALSFLHDREKQVIYRDVKSSNILLDGEFNAKLSDFRLAMDGASGDRTDVSTQVIGTYGYAAPEYIATGHLTAKCDVYGFGVVLLELLSGRRVMDKTKATNEKYLVDWAKPYILGNRKLIRIMDTKLDGEYPMKAAHRVAGLVLKCLNQNPKQRPKMSEVLVELEKP